MKNKTNGIKKQFFMLLLLVIGFVCIKFYESYKLRNDTNTKPVIGAVESSNEDLESFKYLSDLAKDNQKIATVMKNKEDYPKIMLEMLSRNLDMTDYVLGYPKKKGNLYSKTIGEVEQGKYPLLLQYDSRWGYGIYGDEVIAINGCGPTSLAMILAGLTGKNNVTPYDISLYAYNNGYYENGTSWSFFTNGVKKYGIVGTEISLSKSTMIDELEQGHPIICSMRKGDFTTTGHIIAITGISDGKFIINDPASVERSNKLWSYEKIKGQIKNLWSFRIA